MTTARIEDVAERCRTLVTEPVVVAIGEALTTMRNHDTGNEEENRMNNPLDDTTDGDQALVMNNGSSRVVIVQTAGTIRNFRGPINAPGAHFGPGGWPDNHGDDDEG